MDIIKKISNKPHLLDIFTRKEEYNPPFLDEYDRFPYYLSNNRDLMNPVVSELLSSCGLKPDYPDRKKFAVCLTHDIDAIKKGIKGNLTSIASSTYKKKLWDVVDYSNSILNKKKNPYWNFNQIIELEEKYYAKSSFYFLALNPNEKDYNYGVEEVEDEICKISEKGWEVGLHGGHESYISLGDLKDKKKMLEKVLNKKVVGYRNHYLRFKTPETWELLSKAGFKYDTTFGYPDCIGFRNGMCHPFKPFNLNTNKQIDIFEIPLNIMDRTLFNDYMKLDSKTALTLAKKMIDKVESYNGVITILWHNTYLQGDGLKFYEQLLKYCSEKNAWMTSGEEICEFWETCGRD